MTPIGRVAGGPLADWQGPVVSGDNRAGLKRNFRTILAAVSQEAINAAAEPLAIHGATLDNRCEGGSGTLTVTAITRPGS